MADVRARRPALAHLPCTRIEDESGNARIVIRSSTDLAYVHLRLRADDEPAVAAVQAALRGELPRTPSAVKRLPTATTYWLGPDEWLTEVGESNSAPLLRALEENIREHFAAVTDVTDAKVTFAITGPAATDLLRKGCPIDVHPRIFKSGSCAQTALARANVIVVCAAAGAQYTVIADRSDADYLWRWLEDAALEFTRLD